MTSLPLRVIACTGTLASMPVGACHRAPAERAWLRISLPAFLPPDAPPSTLHVRPARAVIGAERAAGVVVLEIDRDVARAGLEVEVDGACPVRLAPGEIPRDTIREVRLGPLLDFGAAQEQVGFDTVFTIDVKPGCEETTRGTIAWRQIAGAPLRGLETTDHGFHLTARTAPAAEILDAARPWGLVPISPRTRGDIVLEAVFSRGGRPVRTHVRVAAAARSRGLPNVPVGVRQFLGGSGWHVVDRPIGGRAAIESQSHVGLAALLPDVSGLWRLRDGGGRELILRAGRYGETPLDCGRGGCHGEIVEATISSPMTAALAHRMAARARPSDDLGCALPCHSVGEPGTADGGFAATAAALGQPSSGHEAWTDLPPPLRRLGGVGCLACHGPGAVPEPSARWTQLRADVCAYCHDAPPRYAHVTAWRASRMATADRDARTRSRPACARCHTTGAFLASLATGGQAAAMHAPAAPDEGAAVIGISCAACHAVHGPPGTPSLRAGLLREVPVPAWLGTPARGQRSGSTLCLACHSPDPTAGIAYASAAAIVLGAGGVEPASGAPLTGPGAHGTNGGGCTACHRAGPDGLGRGASHAFRSARAQCTACHPTAAPIDASLRPRALRLWSRWHPRAAAAPKEGDPASPPHADPEALDRATPLGAALWNVSLVIEDPAAAIHNAPYARRLLDAAETTLRKLAPTEGR